MTECSICCEKFNKTTNSPINCPTCNDKSIIACQCCAKKYILDNNCDPTCMICKTEWDFEFVNKSFTKVFINKDLKKHKEKFLFEKQLAKMPETQLYAQNLKMIEELEKQYYIIKKQKFELSHKLKIQSIQQNDILRTIAEIKHGNVESQKKTTFTLKCPVQGCMGFLDNKYVCGICENKICRHCMEIKNENHECDEDKKQTIALIKKDTKPCPKCGQLIYKIDGCDQMWCPGCKTAFSWNTGKIEQGHIHNPEYYRWMRESGQNLQRDPGDIEYDPCQNHRPTYIQILTQVRIYFPMIKDNERRNIDTIETVIVSNIHRLLGHIDHLRHHDTHNRQRIENDERDLRAQYLLKKINKDEFSKKLQMMNKKRNKECKELNIWNLLLIQLNEYLGKIMTRYPSIDEGRYQIKSTLIEAQKIRKFVNDSFKRIGKLYKTVYPGLTSEWVHLPNTESHLKYNDITEL